MTGIAVTVFSCRQKTESLSIAQLVKTAEVKTREGLLTVTYPGRLRAASDVKLSFRVAGPIQKIFVSEGEYVKKGSF